MNFPQHLRVQQPGCDRVIENFRFAIQKLVDGTKRGDAQSRAARVTVRYGVGHDFSL